MPHPWATWDQERLWAITTLPSATWYPKLRRFALGDVTSPFTPDYNCIAYAAKDMTQPWWPVPEWMMQLPGARYYYWPVERIYPPTVENFYRAFATEGFQPCKTGKHEHGYEKVAIYVVTGDEPKHMARELGDGIWYSKLGDFQDIRHYVFDAVENAGYGQAKYFMRKRIEGISRWAMLKHRLMRIVSGGK